MDRIVKNICVDNCRSHRNGLLPFVLYNGDGGIYEVDGTMRNGNYGQYVCDFTIYSGDTEISRLKYLDVINKYNFIQEQLRNAVFVKKYNYTYEEITKIICGGDNELNTVTETRFKTEFDEEYSKTKYSFIPVDTNYFVNVKDEYIYETPEEYFLLKEKYDSDKESLTETEIFFVEKTDKIESEINSENSFFVLIPNYDIVIQYNNEWNEWWGEHKKEFFNGYAENNTINENFEFCSDIDTYVLGRIEVVGNFNGSKVPNFIYYTEIFDRIDWFKTNSASTIEAYSEPTKENMWLITQWVENGGGEFYDYLSSITYSDKWQTFKKDSDTLKYSAPEISLSIIINAETDNEFLFTPYEYSIVDDVLEDATYEYSAPLSGVGSALTPHFIEFDSATTEVRVDSQLQTLLDPMALQVSNGIYGVYEYFGTSTDLGLTGQMFKCTFRTGDTSNNPEIVCYHSGKTINYKFDTDGNKISENTDYKWETIVGQELEKCPSPILKNTYIVGAEYVSEKKEYKEEIITNDSESSVTYDCYWSAITIHTYQWWECEKVNNNDLKCADGETVPPKQNDKYRNVTIVSCIDSLVGVRSAGDYYYVLARFDNGNFNPPTICEKGEIKTLNIPYTKGKPLNITTYIDSATTYDMVIDITENNENGTITIDYVKGATSGKSVSETGIHYQDIITYKPNNFDIVSIDGVYPAELYYNTIDMDADKEYVYSEEYVLKRKTLRSRIVGMEVGTQWTSSGAVSTLLITKDGTEGLQEEPKYNISLLYNRGNAAAWENHFKLSECNTMEDLENYGNNFFNL